MPSPRLLVPWLSFALLGFSWGAASAQVVAPPPPPRYRVELRYRIDAPAGNRVGQFLDLVRALKAAGFDKDPGPDHEAEDRTATTMTGTVASTRARGLLGVRRVHRLLLVPEGFTPADPKLPVSVDVLLEERFGPVRQRQLASQVLDLLNRAGFREAPGYDRRGGTRLAGHIPFERVSRLLADLREGQKDLPEPIASFWPVRIIEVRPEPAGVAPPRGYVPPPPPPKEESYLLGVAPEVLRAVREAPDRLARLEVLLTDPALATDPATRRELPRSGTVVDIEYSMGLFVVLVAPLRTVPEMMKRPFVQGVRFPQPATPMLANAPAAPARALEHARNAWSIAALHRAGAQGQGVALAVISDDFRNYQRFLGKGLPASTRLIDLTAERDPTLEPDPVAGDPAGVGMGTHQALAVAAAAPKADLLLVRISVDSAHQLHEVARYVAGETRPSPALRRRFEEMRDEEEQLRRLQEELLEERARVLATLPSEDDAAGRKRREAYFKRQAEWQARDEGLRQRRRRYLAYDEDLKRLRQVRIVTNGLVWNDGYPVNGTGAIARRLDGWPRGCALWMQATGDTGGQAWAGLFRDEDGNGLMEFAPAGAKLPPGRWSAELNFLAWQPHGAARSLDLPAGAVVQLSVQWAEAHDGLLRRLGENAYPQPLAQLGFTVLRQRDPSGKRLPTDALEVVARSAPREYRLVRRLHAAANTAVYEHSLVFTVPVAGRYAVQVEGGQHPSIRPPGEETLPMQVRTWELRPRLFVQALDAENRQSGRPVWHDHTSAEGAVGTPADAGMVLTVGATDASGKRRDYSPHGTPLGMQLLPRPDLLVPDGLGPDGVTGTAISAGLAAGTAASAIRSGSGAEALFRAWRGDERTGWSAPGRRAP